MTKLLFIILLYWYNYGSIMVLSQFEVIEETKASKDYDSLQQFEEIRVNKSKVLKESRRNKFPHDFRSAYPPSITYLLWLQNNKRFPSWVYETVRSKYHDDNLEWRINELSKLYKKCDMITGGFPLSGIYIRHLLELINLQKRIDDHSIIQEINTKQDLEYLRSIHLPIANNSTMRLHLRDEDEIFKKVDPIGYLKALASKSSPVREILYRKYLSILQENSSTGEEKLLKDVKKQINRRSNRLQRRNTTKRRVLHKLINTTNGGTVPFFSANDYNPINKIKNIIDLIEDTGLNISMSLRKELRQVCKDYLNNYLEETYNLTNVITQYLEEKQLNDDNIYKKVSNSDLDQVIEKLGNEGKDNKNRESDIFYSDGNDNKNEKKGKNSNVMPMGVINKNINDMKMKSTKAGDKMYSKIKFKSSVEDEMKKRHKFNKVVDFIENTKIYKQMKKEFSENYLLSKYDLIDVLETIGFDLNKKSKQDLTNLYGELLRNKQKVKLKELFNEKNFSLCFPNMRYDAALDMLTSLMLCNINNRRQKNRPKLADVLENLGYNITKSAKKKINKLYLAKVKSNSNNSRQ